MKEGIIKAEDLPEKEKVYLKRSFDGWRVVHPWRNDDGSMNWFNFFTGGSWWNIVFVVGIVAILVSIFFEYSSNIQFFMECFKTPEQLEVCKGLFGYGNI